MLAYVWGRVVFTEGGADEELEVEEADPEDVVDSEDSDDSEELDSVSVSELDSDSSLELLLEESFAGSEELSFVLLLDRFCSAGSEATREIRISPMRSSSVALPKDIAADFRLLLELPREICLTLGRWC